MTKENILCMFNTLVLRRLMSSFVFLLVILLLLRGHAANAGIPNVLIDDWQGFFQCGDSEFHFSLSLREQEVRMSGSIEYKAVNGQRLKMSARDELIGSAEGFGNSLSISSSTLGHTWVRMFYDEQKDRLFGKIDFRGSEMCSYAIAERKETNKLSKDLSDISRKPPQITQSKNLNKCDRDTKKWLTQISQFQSPLDHDPKGLALYFLQDEQFKPHFGKSVFAINDSKLSELNTQLMYGCREQIQKSLQLNEVKGMLQAYLTGAFGTAMNLWLDGQAATATNHWLSRIKQDMAQARQASEDDVTLLRSHLTMFRLPGQGTLNNFNAELLAYGTSQAHKNKHSELANLMKLEPNWTNLLALTRVNPDRNIDPEVRRKLIDSVRTHIAKHWNTAFKSYIAAQDNSIETARDSLIPLTLQPGTGSMMHYLSADAIETINSMILEKRLKLATEFASQESENYMKAFSEPDNEIASMRRWEQVERELKQKYQSLLNDRPFSTFNIERRAYYKKLLNSAHSALLLEVGKIHSPAALDEWINKLFPWDLIDDDDRAVRSKLRLDRLADIAPFYGADHEAYFNAIFYGDVNLIKQFERQHLDSKIDLNLLPRVVSVYLLEYEKRRTRACLRADAIALDVKTTTPETVTKNGMGVVISRTPESTTYNRYRVNKEFESILLKLNTKVLDPGRDFRGVIGGQIGQLYTSMRRVMDTYPCDSIQIQTLEKNFIKLYEDML